jgi:competence protein ComEC
MATAAAGLAGLVTFFGLWSRRRLEDPPDGSPLLMPAVATAAGGLAAYLLGGGLPTAVTWWSAGAAALVLWTVAHRGGRTGLAAGLLLAAVGSVAAAWMVAAWSLFPADDLAWRLTERPEPVVLEGTVVAAPRPLVPAGVDLATGQPNRSTHELTLRLEAIRDGQTWQPLSGRASVVVDGEPPAAPVGTRLRVHGRASRPSPAGNPGEFDFRARARGLRCLSIVHCRERSCLEPLEAGGTPAAGPAGWWTALAATVASARERGIGILRSHLSSADAPLAEAMLLGNRESLPREVGGAFLLSGTVHILSVSGLHVGILAVSLGWLLRLAGVPRGGTALIVAVCTGSYMLLVGAETPVVRATLVVWLACLAVALGRRTATANALAAAFVIVFAIGPLEIMRAGAQLSFLSTAVLLAALAGRDPDRERPDPIERLIERSRGRLERILRSLAVGLLRAAAAGLAVWCVTTPLVAERFHVVSPVAILLNPLIGPLVAAAMACGFLCLVAGIAWAPVAAPFGWACDRLFGGLSGLVATAAAVPGGHFWCAGPPAWTVHVGYALLAALAWALPRAWAMRPAPWLGFAAAWCGLALVAGAAGGRAVPSESLAVTMVSLGHGSGILVESPDGRTLLYDAGRLGAPGAALRGVSAVLWEARVDRIDHLVLSHADADHFNAVPGLLERFRVGEVVVSRAFLDSPAPGVAAIRGLAARRGIPVREVAAGDVLEFSDGYHARVLHPARGRRYDSDNQSSLVLSVEGRGRSLLVTGDLEGEAIAAFARSQSRRWDVLVAPHHGTRTSLPPVLATATRPSLVLVGNAPSPSWPEVREAYAEAVAAGGAVLATADGGAVRVVLGRKRIEAVRHDPAGWRLVWSGGDPVEGQPAGAGEHPSDPSPAGSGS